MEQKETKHKKILPVFDDIIKMLKKGMTQSQIANKYRVSRQAVNNKIKKEEDKKPVKKKQKKAKV